MLLLSLEMDWLVKAQKLEGRLREEYRLRMPVLSGTVFNSVRHLVGVMADKLVDKISSYVKVKKYFSDAEAGC